MVTESKIKTLFTLLDLHFAWLLPFPVSKVRAPQLSTAFHKTGEKSLFYGNHSDGDGNAMYTKCLSSSGCTVILNTQTTVAKENI